MTILFLCVNDDKKYSTLFVGYNMKNKEKYINDVEKRFNGSAKEILLQQIDSFYDDTQKIEKTKMLAMMSN